MLASLLADVAVFAAAAALLVGPDWIPFGGLAGLTLWLLDVCAARRRARESAILGTAPVAGRERRSR